MALAIVISIIWDAILASRFGFWTSAVSMLLSFLCMKYAGVIDQYAREFWARFKHAHQVAFA